MDIVRRNLWEGVHSLLLASDIIALSWWGIELQVQNWKSALSPFFQISLFGESKSFSQRRFLRYFLLALTPFRIDHLFRAFLSRKKWDVIWIHGFFRRLWFLPLFCWTLCSKRIWITHHDFWLLSLFPSQVRSVSQIPRDWKFSSWMTGRTNHVR